LTKPGANAVWEYEIEISSFLAIVELKLPMISDPSVQGELITGT